MARTKKKVAEKVVEEAVEEIVNEVNTDRVEVQPLTQEFGNGDLNTLRDKINELIKANK